MRILGMVAFAVIGGLMGCESDCSQTTVTHMHREVQLVAEVQDYSGKPNPGVEVTFGMQMNHCKDGGGTSSGKTLTTKAKSGSDGIAKMPGAFKKSHSRTPVTGCG